MTMIMLVLLTTYRESEHAIIEGRPTWATGGFAIAVFGGALGCLLLLLRKSAAYYLFIASLLGVVVTMLHTLGIGIDFGLGEILGIILMPPDPARKNIYRVGKALAEISELRSELYKLHPHLKPEK